MTATLLPFVLEVKCKCFQIEKAMVAQSIHRERKFKWFQKYKNCFLILRWQLQNKSRWSVWHLGNKRSITCISTLNITTSKEVPHVSTGVSCIWGKTILFTSKLSASLVNNIMYKHRPWPSIYCSNLNNLITQGVTSVRTPTGNRFIILQGQRDVCFSLATFM